MKININKFCAFLTTFTLAGTMSGCYKTNKNNYNNINKPEVTTSYQNIENSINAENENFEVIAKYNFDPVQSEKWYISDDKICQLSVKIENSNSKVYLDSIDITVNLLSCFNDFDNVVQDTININANNYLFNAEEYTCTFYINGLDANLFANPNFDVSSIDLEQLIQSYKIIGNHIEIKYNLKIEKENEIDTIVVEDNLLINADKYEINNSNSRRLVK